MKIVNNYAAQCFSCASVIVEWFWRNTNFRDTVLRNPQLLVRRSFSSLLYDSIHFMKLGIKEPGTNQVLNTERSKMYRHYFNRCVDLLEAQWDEISKFSRAWNDYFETLAHISMIGALEAFEILDAGFLVKVLEIIWVDGRGDPKKLKKRYFHFVSVREKGRAYSYVGLLDLLATLLDRLDFSLTLYPDGDREQQGRLRGLTPEEVRLLSPSPAQQYHTQRFEWLRRIIVNRQNPVAIGRIVANLAQQHDYASITAYTLTLGLGAEQVMEATSYLEPAIVFCSRCPVELCVLRVLKEALEGIDSINSHYGKEHLDFVTQLMKAENESLNWDELRFRELVLRNASFWAPALLLYPDNNMHCDVSAETFDLLQECLLDPLRNPELLQTETRALLTNARALVEGCVRHIKNNYLSGRTESLSTLEAGQITSIEKIVSHIVDHYTDADNAETEAWIADVNDTMAALRVRAQTVAETLSESWQDNDSLAISDSDNADLTEFGAASP